MKHVLRDLVMILLLVSIVVLLISVGAYLGLPVLLIEWIGIPPLLIGLLLFCWRAWHILVAFAVGNP